MGIFQPGSGSPTGAASGDLTGSYPGPTVAALAVTNAKMAVGAAAANIGAAGLPIADLVDPGAGKVIGSVGSAAAAVRPPGYEFGYAESTTNVTSTATTEAAADTLVSLGAITFDGAPVLFQFFGPRVESSVNVRSVWVVVYEDGATIGAISDNTLPTAGQGSPMSGWLRYTPSAGAHTYIFKTYVNGGAATQTFYAGVGGAGNFRALFGRVTKV